MNDDDGPIPDDYNPLEEATHHLFPSTDEGRADFEKRFAAWAGEQDRLNSSAERLHSLVHPVAEEFIARFDAEPLSGRMAPSELQLSGCACEAIAARLFGQLFVGLSQEHYIAMMQAFQAGFEASRQIASGALHLPEL